MYILIYHLDLCPLSSSCSYSSTCFSINLTTCVLPARPPTALLLQHFIFFILALGLSTAPQCIQGFGFYFANGHFLRGGYYSTFSFVYCRAIWYSIFHPHEYMQRWGRFCFLNEHSLLKFLVFHCFRDYTSSLKSKCSNLCSSYINQQVKITTRCGKKKKKHPMGQSRP